MRAIEIGIILVIVLLIFGIVLTSIENDGQKVIKTQKTNNMEKVIGEVADNLINSPGTPENWNEYGKGTAGLAIVNEGGEIIPNSVSYEKLIALGNDYDTMVYERMFDSKIKTSMELISKDSTVSSVKIGQLEKGDSIYSAARLVKCDFFKGHVIKDFHNGKCNKNHDQNLTSCNYFKIFPKNLKNSNYYLLVDEGEKYDLKYIIETTRIAKERPWQTTLSERIYLNDKIDFYDDDSAVVFVHLNKPDAKAVLVSVPKDFNEDFLKYPYFKTNECKFILKAWYD